jgi:cobalt-zinc-cadmium efflux system outer membrane protein
MCRMHGWLAIGLLFLVGCTTAVRPEVDALVCNSAGRPLDLQPADSSMLPSTKTTALTPSARSRPDAGLDEILLASAQDKKADGPKGGLLERLAVPPAMEGGQYAPIRIPLDANQKPNLPELVKEVKKRFPPLPDVGPDPKPGPAPNGKPLTLADLQALAQANSPLLRQASANVAAARGAMIQAGAYPNPTLSLTGATDGPSGGPTFGPFFDQTIKTMGKLKLAQAAAQMDLENARLAYRRAETDLMATVRTGYYSVLVAEENIAQNRALVLLTDELYKVMVDQLKGGELAVYEPMQVGVFAGQARSALIQARNSYTLAWKQLAASMGLSGMPPTELVGNIRHLPIPQFRYDTCLTHVLANHTDVATAVNGIAKARYNLRLAEVTPIPDVSIQAGLTNDETQPGPNRVTGNFQVGMVLPIWDLNRGGIIAAQGALMNANEQPHQVRDDLTGRVADAFRRQNENFDLLDLYQRDILPKQVQAYRSSVQRHFGGEAGGVAFSDIIAAEQNLVTVIGAYLGVLQNEWQAVSDLGSLLQTNDIFQMAEGKRFVQMPDLTHLMDLPCCHPCSPLPGAHLQGPDLSWPEAGFTPKATATGSPAVPAPAPSILAPATPSMLPPVGSLGQAKPPVNGLGIPAPTLFRQ